MTAYGTHFWKKAPFVKLLLATIAGIIVQWHFQISSSIWWIIIPICFAIIFSFFFISFFSRYKLSFIAGIATIILFFSIGALLAWQKDIRNNKQWLGNFYQEKDKQRRGPYPMVYAHYQKNGPRYENSGNIIPGGDK